MGWRTGNRNDVVPTRNLVVTAATAANRSSGAGFEPRPLKWLSDSQNDSSPSDSASAACSPNDSDDPLPSSRQGVRPR